MLNTLYSLVCSTFTTTLGRSLYKLYSWANWCPEGSSYSLRILQTVMAAPGLKLSSVISKTIISTMMKCWTLLWCASQNQRLLLLGRPCQLFTPPPDHSHWILPWETLSPHHMHFSYCHSRCPTLPGHMTSAKPIMFIHWSLQRVM